MGVYGESAGDGIEEGSVSRSKILSACMVHANVHKFVGRTMFVSTTCAVLRFSYAKNEV
jgi:hypothetical protein